jgi:hypothetical protein
MNIIEVDKIGYTVTYGDKKYRVQNDRGHKHIVVRIDGKRKKITVKERKWDLFYWYVLEGLFEKHPCKVIDWWIEMRRVNKLFI